MASQHAYCCDLIKKDFPEMNILVEHIRNKDWKGSNIYIEKQNNNSIKFFLKGFYLATRENPFYDQEQSVWFFEQSALLGCTEAKLWLAMIYLNSKSPLLSNINKGVQLYREILPEMEAAAKLGITGSLCNMGHLHTFGIVVEKDLKKAFEYYSMAKSPSESCKENFELLKKILAEDKYRYRWKST